MSAVQLQTSSQQQDKVKSKALSYTHGSSLPKGTGYGPECGPYTPPEKVDAVRQKMTTVLQAYFEALGKSWPSVRTPWSYNDMSSAEAMLAMLARSPMLHHAADLLRYASLEQMADLLGPLNAVLDFLEAVSRHVATRQVLLWPLPILPAKEQLASVILEGHKSNKSSAATEYETSQPLAVVVQRLAIPCRKYLDAARKSGAPISEQDAPLVALLERICGLDDTILSLRRFRDICGSSISLPARVSRTNVTTRRMRAEMEKAKELAAVREQAKIRSEWHRANCVKEVPDDVIMSVSYYAAKASKIDTTNLSKNRMKKILSQVSSLSTDLPEGIYVRHGESRVDLLRIIIFGPIGTPYEHGIFEFDMFIPGQFPDHPPEMFFRTTGNGRIRFNPNLYANGKGMYFRFITELVAVLTVGFFNQSVSRSWAHGKAKLGILSLRLCYRSWSPFKVRGLAAQTH
jgi:hypothetical protein